MKLNGTWFPLLTSDKAVFAEPARPKGTAGLRPKKKPPPPPPYPKPPASEPPEDIFQHRTQAPAEQAPAADKVEDAATNTRPDVQAPAESVPTADTLRTERPTPDVLPPAESVPATYVPPPPPEAEYVHTSHTERPPSPPPEAEDVPATALLPPAEDVPATVVLPPAEDVEPQEQRGEPQEQRGEPQEQRGEPEEQRGEPQEQRGEPAEQRGESQEQPEEVAHRKRKRRRYSKSNTWRTGIRNPEASHVLEH